MHVIWVMSETGSLPANLQCYASVSKVRSTLSFSNLNPLAAGGTESTLLTVSSVCCGLNVCATPHVCAGALTLPVSRLGPLRKSFRVK